MRSIQLIPELGGGADGYRCFSINYEMMQSFFYLRELKYKAKQNHNLLNCDSCAISSGAIQRQLVLIV